MTKMNASVDAVIFALSREMTELETSDRIALVEALQARLGKMAADLRAHLGDDAVDQAEVDEKAAEILAEAGGSLNVALDACVESRSNDDADAFWDAVEARLEVLASRGA